MVEWQNSIEQGALYGIQPDIQASFSDKVSAILDQNWVVKAAKQVTEKPGIYAPYAYFDKSEEPDPEFNPEEELSSLDQKYHRFSDKLLKTNNKQSFYSVINRIDEESTNNEILASSGPAANIAAFATSMVDPIWLIPLGGAGKLGQALEKAGTTLWGRSTITAAEFAGLGLASEAVENQVSYMHDSSPSEMASHAFVGGLIGAGIGAIPFAKGPIKEASDRVVSSAGEVGSAMLSHSPESVQKITANIADKANNVIKGWSPYLTLKNTKNSTVKRYFEKLIPDTNITEGSGVNNVDLTRRAQIDRFNYKIDTSLDDTFKSLNKELKDNGFKKVSQEQFNEAYMDAMHSAENTYIGDNEIINKHISSAAKQTRKSLDEVSQRGLDMQIFEAHQNAIEYAEKNISEIENNLEKKSLSKKKQGELEESLEKAKQEFENAKMWTPEELKKTLLVEENYFPKYHDRNKILNKEKEFIEALSKFGVKAEKELLAKELLAKEGQKITTSSIENRIASFTKEELAIADHNARKVAQEYSNNILNTSDGFLSKNIFQADVRGSLKQRTSYYPYETLKPWLNKSPRSALRKMADQVYTDASLKEYIGDTSGNLMKKEIEAAYDSELAEASTNAAKKKLRDSKKEELHALDLVLSRMRGLNRKSPNGMLESSMVKAGNVVRNLGVFKLGGIVLSALPDVGVLTMWNGTGEVLRSVGERFLMKLGGKGSLLKKVEKAYMDDFAISLQHASDTSAAKGLAEFATTSEAGLSKLEKASNSATKAFFKLTMMEKFDGITRRIGVQTSVTQLRRAAEALKKGKKLTSQQRKLLNRYKLSADSDVLSNLLNNGKWHDNLFVANIDQWSDNAAAQQMRNIAKDIERHAIVHPRLEHTPEIFDSNIGKVLLQFKSFMLASFQDVALPAAANMTDLNTFGSLALMQGLGMFSVVAKRFARGQDQIDDYGELFFRGLAASDATGMMADLGTAFNLASGGGHYGQDLAEFIMGPSVSTVRDLTRGVSATKKKVFGNKEITPGEERALLRMNPISNLWWVQLAKRQFSND